MRVVNKRGRIDRPAKESPVETSGVRSRTRDPGAEAITVRPLAAPMSGRYSRLDSEARDSLVSRRVRQMNRAYDAHDYEGALISAARILSMVPGHPHAIACTDACSGTLEREYLAQLGGILVVFEIAVEGPRLGDLLRDPRTAFLVPLLGELELGEVLDYCGERRLDALRVLVDLVRKGVIRAL